MTARMVARAFIGRLTGWDGDCPMGKAFITPVMAAR
jgi:hypothetical protein